MLVGMPSAECRRSAALAAGSSAASEGRRRDKPVRTNEFGEGGSNAIVGAVSESETRREPPGSSLVATSLVACGAVAASEAARCLRCDRDRDRLVRRFLVAVASEPIVTTVAA